MSENEAIEVIFGLLDGIRESRPMTLKEASEADEIITMLKELEQYRAIGTPDECRAAVDKQNKKKPIKDECGHECCPTCGWMVWKDEWGGRYLPHCENCGQAVSWDFGGAGG